MTERALRQAEWDGALHYRLARIYQQMGEAALAQKEFAASARRKSEDRESVSLLLECSNHILKGDLPEAMRIRGDLMSDAALDPDVLIALGLAFTSAGMHQESLQPFETAAQRDPILFPAQYNSGLALLKLGRAPEAISHLEAALRLAPDSADTLSALSVAYVLTGRYQDAIKPLEQWSVLQPGNTRQSTLLALAFLRTGAPAKAIPLLRNCIPQTLNDPKPRFLLIEALNAVEKQTEAVEVAEEAARLFPQSAQAHLAKAQQLARVGRYEDAGPEFRRALELSPGQIESLLGLAEVEQKEGNYAASLSTYQAVLTSHPEDLAARLGASRNLMLLQRHSEAQALLEAAAQAHPDNPQVHYELSRVYARLGERDRAAEQLRIVDQLRTPAATRP